MEKYDYKAALKYFDEASQEHYDYQTSWAGMTYHMETILHALRFAEKMMQEPSHRAGRVGIDTYEDMMGGARLPDGECYDHEVVSGIFKSMRDQALKELGE